MFEKELKYRVLFHPSYLILMVIDSDLFSSICFQIIPPLPICACSISSAVSISPAAVAASRAVSANFHTKREVTLEGLF